MPDPVFAATARRRNPPAAVDVLVDGTLVATNVPYVAAVDRTTDGTYGGQRVALAAPGWGKEHYRRVPDRVMALAQPSTPKPEVIADALRRNDPAFREAAAEVAAGRAPAGQSRFDLLELTYPLMKNADYVVDSTRRQNTFTKTDYVKALRLAPRPAFSDLGTAAAPPWDFISVDANGDVAIDKSPGLSNLFPAKRGGGVYAAPALSIRAVAFGPGQPVLVYGSVEAAYQASKALYFDQQLGTALAEKLFPETIGPVNAKRAGGKASFVRALARQMGGTQEAAAAAYDSAKRGWFGLLSADGPAAYDRAMRDLLAQKFAHPPMKALLARTAPRNLYNTASDARRPSIWDKGSPMADTRYGVLGEMLVALRG